MQDQGDGLRPIAFMSRALKQSEQRYSAYERELAAVAYCFIQWRHYLEGCPKGVTVVTDHQPLTHLLDQPVLSRVQVQWVRRGLFPLINPTIKYQPGKANIVADALSRSKRAGTQTTEMAKASNQASINVLTRSSIVPTNEVQKWLIAQKEDPVTREAMQRVPEKSGRHHFSLTPQGLLYYAKDGQQKLIVPTSQNVLKSCHNDPTAGHVGITRTLELPKWTYWWKQMG